MQSFPEAVVDLKKLVVPSFMATYSDRRFCTMSVREATKVYEYLEDSSSPTHFLWSLHFLKVYPTESVGACFSKAKKLPGSSGAANLSPW